MSKIIIIEGNSNDKDNFKCYMVKGEKGEKGETGPIADNHLQIGTVTSGATASAEIVGESPNQTLNLVLPKGDKGDEGEQGEKGDPGDVSNGQIYYQANDTFSISHEYDPQFMISGYKIGNSISLMVPLTKMINGENIGISVSKLKGSFRKTDGTLIGNLSYDYAEFFDFISAIPIEYRKGNCIMLNLSQNAGTLVAGITDYTQINFFAEEVGLTFTSIS